MSDNDLIRRGDALLASTWLTPDSTPLADVKRVAEAIAALPAVSVGVNPEVALPKYLSVSRGELSNGYNAICNRDFDDEGMGICCFYDEDIPALIAALAAFEKEGRP
jgi:hypothetical protein